MLGTQVFDFSEGPPLGGSPVAPADNIATQCRATCGVCGLDMEAIKANILLFTKFDSNGDGTIEGDELKALRKANLCFHLISVNRHCFFGRQSTLQGLTLQMPS